MGTAFASFGRMRRLAVFLPQSLLLALASVGAAASGCGESRPGERATGAPSHDAATGEDPAAAGGDGGCGSATLPLIVATDWSEGRAVPMQLFVPVTYREQPSVFQLDTGSSYTFLHEPLADGGTTAEVTTDAGSVAIGCEVLDVAGIGIVDSPPVDGKPVIGTFGDDRLLARPVMLDFTLGQVAWNAPGTPFSEAASWPSTPFDRPAGYVRVRDVTFDGEPVTLLVDTGAADSVWVGQPRRPGDVQVDGEDAQGDMLALYRGTVTIGMGIYQESVPVFRVASFPYLEKASRILGAPINGLLGLSAFGRGIVFDTDANRVRVAP
jgi:hypothetical protein